MAEAIHGPEKKSANIMYLPYASHLGIQKDT